VDEDQSPELNPIKTLLTVEVEVMTILKVYIDSTDVPTFVYSER
jgi:hypothetical protein